MQRAEEQNCPVNQFSKSDNTFSSGLRSKFSFSNQAGVIIVLISVKVIDDQRQEQKGRELQEPAGIISCYKFPRGNVPIDSASFTSEAIRMPYHSYIV